MTHHGFGESQLMELRTCPICHSVQAKGSSCDICGNPLTLVDANYLAGRTLGKYRIESFLGAGGMGMVYRASHVTLNKIVALKILLPRIESASEEFAKRFLREARVLAELHHPNIVEIYDMDITEWGAPYYVMEHLQGLSLVEYVERFGGALPETWVAEITEKLVSGLAFAHSRGIIHRDLKPENIFLSLFGKAVVPKILDFGIAKLLEGHENTTRLTSTGAVVGTPEYLTPEQVLNRELGGWTDQYTLALVVAEMLTGSCPRAGKSLLEIVSTEIHRPLDLISLGIPSSKPCAQALYKATQPEPENRFTSVYAFMEALQLEKSPETAGEMAHWLEAEVSENSRYKKNRESGHSDSDNIGSDPYSIPDKGSSTRRVIPEKQQKLTLKPSHRHPPKFGWKVWGSLALLPLVMLFFVWNIIKTPVFTANKKNNTSREISCPLLVLNTKWNLAPDTKGVLGQEENNILVRGASGVYLIENATGKYASFPYPAHCRFLAGDGSIGSFLMKGKTLLHWNPKEETLEIIAKGMPSLREDEKIISCRLNMEQNRILYATNKQVRLLVLENGKVKLLFSAATGGGDCFLALGEEVAAFSLSSGEIHVLHSENGKTAAILPVKELRLFSIALSESLHMIAVAGWFDKIYLLNYQHPEQANTISLKGKTLSVSWLGNGTTLIAGGEYGLMAWNKRTGIEKILPSEEVGKIMQVFRGKGNILAIDEDGKLCTFFYNKMPHIICFKLRENSIWAMSTAPSNQIFAGDSGGGLFKCNSRSITATYPLHTLGITAMASDGKFLATSSDDKTIAIWKLPEMQVEWRSRAHRFLVNGLWINKKSLWSVSSDGNAKEWSWPDMDQKQVIQISNIFPDQKVSCQSIWSASNGKRVLVGTWDKGIVALEKHKPAFEWRHFQTAAKVIYQATQVPDMALVAFSAFAPSAAYIYDLQANKLYRLPIFHSTPTSLCAGRDHEIWYYGPGSIMQYRFTRGKDGIVHFSASGGMESAMDIGISGCLASDKQHLVIGNENGKVFWWNIAELEEHLSPPVSGMLTHEIPAINSGTLARNLK